LRQPFLLPENGTCFRNGFQEVQYYHEKETDLIFMVKTISSNPLSMIDILILCGGFGKRLQPIVSDRQKVLADVIGHPFITFILEQVLDTGGDNVILCTGYMGKQIEISLGKRYKSLSLHYSQETEPLGTAGAVRHAIGLIKSATLMVFNGDSYCDINPKDLLEWHFLKNSSCTLTLVKMSDVSRYGSVNFDSNNLVTSFDEKSSDKKNGWINAGIYCMSRELIAALPGNRNISLEKDLFPTLIGKEFFAFPREAKFIDIGTPSSYKEAETFFMKVDRFNDKEKSRSDKL
jgi:D-glycero-alpha-D-manno-heptose 1-phosphate guanylyltransferase